MQAGQVLHRLLRRVCGEMHKMRRTALFVNVMAALRGEVLTVSISGSPLRARPKRSTVSSERIACYPTRWRGERSDGHAGGTVR
jgi:hypothetical protein